MTDRRAQHGRPLVASRGLPSSPTSSPTSSPALIRAGRALAIAVAVAAVVGGSRCSSPPQEPLLLEGNRLTVDNRTKQDWNDVRIDLNTYYRISAPTIRAGSRFQAPLDVFVAGFGQRFDFRRTQIHSLKLTAKLPDGQPLELNKKFQLSGLAGALGGKK